MEIGSIRTSEPIQFGAQTKPQTDDAVSKNLQNKISDVKRQRQELVSKEGLSEEEKSQKRKELQQEINSLDRQLRQRQTVTRGEQKRTSSTDEKQTDITKKTEDQKQTEDSDITSLRDKGSAAGETRTASTREDETKNRQKTEKEKSKDEQAQELALSPSDARNMLAGQTQAEQAKQQKTVIARMEGGVVILKGELKQDETRGQNVERKQAALSRQEKKMQQVENFQLPTAGRTNENASKNQKIREEAAKRTAASALGIRGDQIIIQ